MKFKLSLFLMGVCLVALLVAFVSSNNVTNDFKVGKEAIIMRNIGHQLLQNVGDSTSRILPVTTISENTYQITFENSFKFTPDSLVKIINQIMATYKL